jgi:hypothetical protein
LAAVDAAPLVAVDRRHTPRDPLQMLAHSLRDRATSGLVDDHQDPHQACMPSVAPMLVK